MFWFFSCFAEVGVGKTSRIKCAEPKSITLGLMQMLTRCCLPIGLYSRFYIAYPSSEWSVAVLTIQNINGMLLPLMCCRRHPQEATHRGTNKFIGNPIGCGCRLSGAGVAFVMSWDFRTQGVGGWHYSIRSEIISSMGLPPQWPVAQVSLPL